MYKIVGIGDYAVSNDPNDIIKTLSLGSCIAITFYCPYKKVAGMVHIVLPDSVIDIKKSRLKPGYFADVAVPLMFDKMKEYGCNERNLKINLFGGARAYSLKVKDTFNIGVRNLEAIEKILDESRFMYDYTNTGGTVSRTVELEVDTGHINLYTHELSKV